MPRAVGLYQFKHDSLQLTLSLRSEIPPGVSKLPQDRRQIGDWWKDRTKAVAQDAAVPRPEPPPDLIRRWGIGADRQCDSRRHRPQIAARDR